MVEADVDNLQTADSVEKLVYRQFTPLDPLFLRLIFINQIFFQYFVRQLPILGNGNFLLE